MLSNFKRAVETNSWSSKWKVAWRKNSLNKGFKDNTDEKMNKKINKINKQPN